MSEHAVSNEIVAIAAVGSNGVIGADQDIPWRIPEDWKRFKAITMGQVLIMGRKTFDSIGRPLPGRHTIVITRDTQWRADGVVTASSVDAALSVGAAKHPDATLFVAGGGEIYRAAWDRLDRMEITEVDQAPKGTVTFPEITSNGWVETDRVPRDGFSFVSYRRH